MLRWFFLHFFNEGKAWPPIYIILQDGLKELDNIDALPGQPKCINFDQYVGYVTVEPLHGKVLFCCSVESPQDPAKKLLYLWLNRGKGIINRYFSYLLFMLIINSNVAMHKCYILAFFKQCHHNFFFLQSTFFCICLISLFLIFAI